MVFMYNTLEVVIFPKNDGLRTMDYTINHGIDVTDNHDYLTNALW